MFRFFVQRWADLQRRSGLTIAVSAAIGVLGVALGVLVHANLLPGMRSSSDSSRARLAAAQVAERPGEARVGHLIYDVTSARLQRGPDPKNPDRTVLLARIGVRIADVEGISDYIDNETFRLVVNGDTLSHTNNVNLTVYENSATQADLVFLLPGRTTSAELLVGRPSDGVGRIELELTPRQLADGS